MKHKNLRDPDQTMSELGIEGLGSQIIFLSYVCAYVEGALDYSDKEFNEKEILQLLAKAVKRAARDVKDLEKELEEEEEE